MKKPDPIIEIIIVGDEILSDPGRDTNSGHIADVLARNGFGISGITVTGDVEGDIIRVLTGAAGRADAVLVTGGLGPTSDDLTIPSAAQAFGLPLVLDEPSLKAIADFFLQRNRPMTESNRKQAMLPRASQALKNTTGTAPGVFLEI
jgi:nicotinamide-nucleotide amidase